MYGDYFYLSILSSLFWPVLIILLIYFFIRRRFKGNPASSPVNDENWYLQLSLSKEDTVSQFLMFISIFLFGVTLLSINRDLNNPLSWKSIILISTVVGFLVAYFYKLIYTLAFSTIGLLSWWGTQSYEWIETFKIKPAAYLASLVLILLLFFTLGRVHEKQVKFKRFAMVYFMIGLLGFTAIIFYFSTKMGLSTLADATEGKLFVSSWQFNLSMLVLLGGLIGSLIFTIYNKLVSFGEVLAIILFATLFLTISFLPGLKLFDYSVNDPYYLQNSSKALNQLGVVWAIIFNVLTFFEVLGFILLGYFRKEIWLINLGVVILFLLVIIKYFDWFFTFLDKSVFFIGAGIILFVVGFAMERGRRMMLSSIKNNGPV